MFYKRWLWPLIGVLFLSPVLMDRNIYADQTNDGATSSFEGTYYYQGGFYFPKGKWNADPKRDQQIILKFSDGKLNGILFGAVNLSEETGDADSRYGYFENFMKNLTVTPSGNISFTIEERDFYSTRMTSTKRKWVGTDKNPQTYSGKILKGEIQIKCEGCSVDHVMIFKKTNDI